MSPLQLLWEMLIAIFQLLWLMWPITVAILVMAIVKVVYYFYQRRRRARSGIAEVDRMSGKEFEQFLEQFFQRLGYHVRRTPYQGDYGADLILRSGDEQTVVQAKRHKGNVGIKAVQEAVAAKEYYKCARAMVVTNSGFTEQAQRLAKANKVELWGRAELVTRLLEMGQKPAEVHAKPPTHPRPEKSTEKPSGQQTGKPTGVVTFAATTETLVRETPRTTPARTIPTPNSTPVATCTVCGKPVSPRVQAYCASRPDLFQGRIYCYEHQRTDAQAA